MTAEAMMLAAAVEEFRLAKRQAERAMGQVADEDLHFRLHGQQCSIAVYIRHLAGNMRSRWTDFLTTDGEKPDRDRDAEFAEGPATREELMALWEQGWAVLFESLGSLSEGDLGKTVMIRKEPHTVIRAIVRQVGHYSWHVGQIALLAKCVKVGRGEGWEYLTIAPGKSGEFNRGKGM